METKDIASIAFVDADSRDDGFAIVRKCDTNVVISISLRANGDIQVAVDADVAKKLAQAIASAVDG